MTSPSYGDSKVLALNQPFPALSLSLGFPLLVRHKHEALTEAPHGSLSSVPISHKAGRTEQDAHVPPTCCCVARRRHDWIAHIQRVTVVALHFVTCIRRLFLEKRLKGGRGGDDVAVESDGGEQFAVCCGSRGHVKGGDGGAGGLKGGIEG